MTGKAQVAFKSSILIPGSPAVLSLVSATIALTVRGTSI